MIGEPTVAPNAYYFDDASNKIRASFFRKKTIWKLFDRSIYPFMLTELTY
jgi:hypothetical protein